MPSESDATSRWLDEQYAARYLRFTAPVAPDAEEWISRLALGPASTVLDLGCGEAKVLTALSGAVARGIGIDASPAMLRAGRRHASEQRAATVELVRSDFRRLPLSDASCDAALSNAALHHVPNAGKRHCLEELARVLRPGALFHLRDDAFNFDPQDLERLRPRIYEEFEREFGPAGWAFLRDHLAGADFECTPYTRDLLALLEDAGFEIVDCETTGLDGVEIRARARGVEA